MITESGGDWFNDVDTVLFEKGVELIPPAGEIVQWMNLNNVLADNNELFGFHYTGAGTIRGISCVRCWSSSNGMGTVNGTGLRIDRGRGLSFTDSRIINNGGHGVVVSSGVVDLAISGGIFAANCIAPACTSGLAHGIILTGVDGSRISGVRSGPTFGGTSRQGYGIFLNTGSNNYIVTGNDTRGNLLGGIRNVPGLGPTRIVKDNL